MTGPDVLAGTGTDTSKSRRNGFGVNIPLPYGFSLNLGAGTTRSSDTDTFELALQDMDGDGAPDHTLRRTTVGGTPTIYIKHNQITGQANLLRAVHRPLGGSFTLGYQRVGNTVDLPSSRHVLSRVEIDDGQDLGPAFASPNLVTTIEYIGGFFHRYEKEFFGFSRVTTRRADGVTVEDQYENRTYQLHGRLLHQLRRDSANQVFHRRDLSHTPNAVLDEGGMPVDADPGCVAGLHPLLGL